MKFLNNLRMKGYWANALTRLQKEWYEENSPLGKSLGYPECCIDEFCAQPPDYLRITGTDANDRLRLEAGSINGKFTGFVPCLHHARMITNGKLKLTDLIHGRDRSFVPFPEEFSREEINMQRIASIVEAPVNTIDYATGPEGSE